MLPSRQTDSSHWQIASDMFFVYTMAVGVSRPFGPGAAARSASRHSGWRARHLSTHMLAADLANEWLLHILHARLLSSGGCRRADARAESVLMAADRVLGLRPRHATVGGGIARSGHTSASMWSSGSALCCS
jgi:hypothetical protein